MWEPGACCVPGWDRGTGQRADSWSLVGIVPVYARHQIFVYNIKLQMVWNLCPEKGPREPRGMCVSQAYTQYWPMQPEGPES